MSKLAVWYAAVIARWSAFQHVNAQVRLGWAQGRMTDAVQEHDQATIGLKAAIKAEQDACKNSELAYLRKRRAVMRAEIGL